MSNRVYHLSTQRLDRHLVSHVHFWIIELVEQRLEISKQKEGSLEMIYIYPGAETTEHTGTTIDFGDSLAEKHHTSKAWFGYLKVGNRVDI
jgi:hypothetical protein